MKNMIQRKHISSGGYALKGTDISLVRNPNRNYTLHNIITNEIINFNSIRKFSIEHNLEPNYVLKLLNGKRKTPYKGWTTSNMDLTLYNKHQVFIGKKIISPNGIIYTLNTTPYMFAKQHPPLDRKDIYMLINKKTVERKGGWKLYEL
jgi:hypothetical protein